MTLSSCLNTIIKYFLPQFWNQFFYFHDKKGDSKGKYLYKTLYVFIIDAILETKDIFSICY